MKFVAIIVLLLCLAALARAAPVRNTVCVLTWDPATTAVIDRYDAR